MVKPATIINIAEVSEVIREHHVNPEEIMCSRLLILSDQFLVFVRDSMLILLEIQSSDVLELHVYCNRENRGRPFVEFLKEVDMYLKTETNFSTVFMDPPPNRRDIRILLLSNGGKKVHEGLYSYTIGGLNGY